jgi:hypothetical protein
MEGVLDTRMRDIGLQDVASITKELEHDCLFECFRHSVTSASSLPKEVKKLAGHQHDGEQVAFYQLTFKYAAYEEAKYDVSSIQGLRDVCADAAYQFTASLTPIRTGKGF